MPSNRSFGPPLRSRLREGQLQFFDGQGWIPVSEYINGAHLTTEEVAEALATALEEADENEPEDE